MHIVISKEDLVYAVGAVERAVSTKNTLPVLSGILISAAECKVSFRATDLEVAVECTVGAMVDDPGQMVAPGRKFSALVRLLPDGPITLSSHYDQLQIDYGASSVNVPCFAAEDFPLLPEAEGEIGGSIPVPAFRRMIRQVGIAAATDELRPAFTGILTELNEDEIIMVATDTHRLARYRGKWNGSGSATLIIPNRVLQEIARLAADDTESVSIVASKNQVFFRFANLAVTSRLIVGQYPDYRQVIPDESQYCAKITVDTTAFAAALERAALIARNSGSKNSAARLVLVDEGFHVCVEIPDEGRIDELLPCPVEGDKLVIHYNIRYLLDVLKVLEGDKVCLNLTGANTPGVITADADTDNANGDYLYLLLPVRVSR